MTTIKSIEIRKTVKDKIWDVQTVFGTNKTSIDSVLNRTKIFKNKKDTLLFKGSNFILDIIAFYLI